MNIRSNGSMFKLRYDIKIKITSGLVIVKYWYDLICWFWYLYLREYMWRVIFSEIKIVCEMYTFRGYEWGAYYMIYMLW